MTYMIPWYWLIITAMLGGTIGAIVAAVCIAGGKADAHIGTNDRPTSPRPSAPPPQGGTDHA